MPQVKIRYGFDKLIKDVSFTNALVKVKNTVKEYGFNILCDIDMKKNIQDDLNLYFNKYHILEICHPKLSYKALKAEYEIGLLLPVNLIIYETEDGVKVAIANPDSYTQMIDNPEIIPIMQELKGKIMRIIEDI